MSSDRERWFEIATMIGQRLNTTLEDVVPPEAQKHLLNAQRELLTALFLIYEHQAGARRPEAPARRRSRTSSRSAAGSRPARRVQHIEID
jgi:hypothetical protein